MLFATWATAVRRMASPAKARRQSLLASRYRGSGAPPHERYVILLPLALSKTQDDKGRVRWSLFGSSEQGPANAFWKSFFTRPRREVPQEWSEGFMRRLLAAAYDEKPEALADLRKRASVFTRIRRPPCCPPGKKSRCHHGPSLIVGKKGRSAACVIC